MDKRTMYSLILHASPEECREMGALFSDLADSPRDDRFRSTLKNLIANEPQTEFTKALEAARTRVVAHNDDLRRTGWHPDQMKAKLLALGYSEKELLEPATEGAPSLIN
jgi:hypothetical protein